MEVSDVNKHGCKLKWDKPEDDGGSPVEYYEIEKLDPLTGQWVPCGRSTEPEATITGLQEGKPYKFRVKAVNREGESDDLEADKSIIAKNPFGRHLGIRRLRICSLETENKFNFEILHIFTYPSRVLRDTSPNF